MDQLAFREFVKSAVLRAVPQPRTIGRLTLTQTERNDEPKLREPEMRHALAQVAEGWTERYYGIEVPTEETYRFVDDEGDKETAARHDFAVYSGATANADRLILLELKKDQPELVGEVDPDCPKVRKDFQKLIVERAHRGKSMLHILHAADGATIPAVYQKYNAGIRWALHRATPVVTVRLERNPLDDASWFTFFILVVRMRRQGNRPALYFREFPRFGDLLSRVAAGEEVFRQETEWQDALENGVD